MDDNNTLSLLGLCKRAGRLEVGEEPVGAACRAKDCRLLVLASNAANNTFRRAKHFAELGNCLLVKLACSKEELGAAVGTSVCAMAAITDVGFASALAKKLAAAEPEHYAELARQLDTKAKRAQERRQEQRQHEKNLRAGKARVRSQNKRKP